MSISEYTIHTVYVIYVISTTIAADITLYVALVVREDQISICLAHLSYSVPVCQNNSRVNLKADIFSDPWI